MQYQLELSRGTENGGTEVITIPFESHLEPLAVVEAAVTAIRHQERIQRPPLTTEAAK